MIKNYFRRKNPTLYEKESPSVKFTESENAETGETSNNVPADEDYSLLITAQDNNETVVIESILRNARIPYVTRETDTESWMRVMMGFNIFGKEFYVPTRLLDDAAALLVPQDAEGEDIITDGEDIIADGEDSVLDKEDDNDA